MVRFGKTVRTAYGILACFACLACNRGTPPPAPQDVDLSVPRGTFHCSAPRDANETEACRILNEFANAHAITEWPTGKEVQAWLGVDHCVTPATTPDFDAYQLVYLRAGDGTPPPEKTPAENKLAYSAVFGANQLKKGAIPNTEEALRNVAQGVRPDASKMAGVDLMIGDAADNAFQTLVRTPSGISVGDGSIWFLRSDGNHLILVGPQILSGCVSELFRIPADLIHKPSSPPASSK